MTVHRQLSEISWTSWSLFPSPAGLAVAHCYTLSFGNSSEHSWHCNAGATHGFPLRGICLNTGNGWSGFEKEPTVFSKLPHFEWVNSVLGKVLTVAFWVPVKCYVRNNSVYFHSLFFSINFLEVHFLNLTFIILRDLANINDIKSLLPST